MPQTEKPVIPPLEVPRDVPYTRALNGDSKRIVITFAVVITLVGGALFTYMAWRIDQAMEGYFDRGSVEEHEEVHF